MSEDLAKYESGLSNLDDNDLRVKIQNFQTILHKEPRADEVQINKQANNSKYIPISHLEMKLDEMFFGIWSTKNFTSSTVANELIGSIELWYFHPTAKTWLCRVGAGAVMVQYKKDSDIMDIGNKIKNTLTKDYPHLKAECFRNACISLGKSFGRDLNREFDDQYNPIIKESIPDVKITMKKIIDALDSYTGNDKEKLKQECITANKNGTFDELFAEIMAKKIGLKL
jgi:hypothetical protein